MTIRGNRDDELRFLAKVRKTSACWYWTASRNAKGYGKFGIGGSRWMFAHIWSYEHYVGPRGTLHVLHRCDVPWCVRPDHLELGTLGKNTRDRVERHGWWNSRGLTRSIVALIRATLFTKGVTKKLARRFEVRRVTIWRARTGRSWPREET